MNEKINQLAKAIVSELADMDREDITEKAITTFDAEKLLNLENAYEKEVKRFKDFFK